MRQAASTIIVCVCVVLASTARASDGASDAAGTISRARRLIDAKDHASAVTLLEDVLLESNAQERATMLGILKQSYEVLAREAEAAGRDRQAAYYRGNLEILGASPPTREPAPPTSPRVKPAQGPSSPVVIHGEQKPTDRPPPAGPQILSPAPNPEAPAPSRGEPAALSEPPVMPKPEPAPRLAAEPASSRRAGAEQPPAGPSPEEADRLFSAKKYDEAGRCYAVLAREKRLPTNRTDHWAYCRIVRVATRLNARPKTTSEWDEIEAEIQSIQRLAPNLWYGEYLRNRLAEVRKGRSRTQTQTDNLVVRGSAPDESQGQPRRFPRLFGKSRSPGPSNADAEAPPASAAPESKGDGSTTTTPAAEWQVHDTPNFRIFHTDPRLAELAAEAAEKVRAAQAKRWGSLVLQKPWNPRCEIHLHPTGKAFALATGQAETTPGFSTIESNGNRITTRRVLLRGDHPQLLTAILPHEVTHVVVADLFTTQQIPRWADEGIAVLSEPGPEQALRAADLHEPLSAGQVFDLRQLMSIETPDAKDWSLYYAQSVSLTRFLVEQGTPEQLIQFVQESGRKGIEAALRETYKIGGFAELQERWQAYARQQLATSK